MLLWLAEAFNATYHQSLQAVLPKATKTSGPSNAPAEAQKDPCVAGLHALQDNPSNVTQATQLAAATQPECTTQVIPVVLAAATPDEYQLPNSLPASINVPPTQAVATLLVAEGAALLPTQVVPCGSALLEVAADSDGHQHAQMQHITEQQTEPALLLGTAVVQPDASQLLAGPSGHASEAAVTTEMAAHGAASLAEPCAMVALTGIIRQDAAGADTEQADDHPGCELPVLGQPQAAADIIPAASPVPGDASAVSAEYPAAGDAKQQGTQVPASSPSQVPCASDGPNVQLEDPQQHATSEAQAAPESQLAAGQAMEESSPAACGGDQQPPEPQQEARACRNHSQEGSQAQGPDLELQLDDADASQGQPGTVGSGMPPQQQEGAASEQQAMPTNGKLPGPDDEHQAGCQHTSSQQAPEQAQAAVGTAASAVAAQSLLSPEACDVAPGPPTATSSQLLAESGAAQQAIPSPAATAASDGTDPKQRTVDDVEQASAAASGAHSSRQDVLSADGDGNGDAPEQPHKHQGALQPQQQLQEQPRSQAVLSGSKQLSQKQQQPGAGQMEGADTTAQVLQQQQEEEEACTPHDSSQHQPLEQQPAIGHPAQAAPGADAAPAPSMPSQPSLQLQLFTGSREPVASFPASALPVASCSEIIPATPVEEMPPDVVLSWQQSQMAGLAQRAQEQADPGSRAQGSRAGDAAGAGACSELVAVQAMPVKQQGQLGAETAADDVAAREAVLEGPVVEGGSSTAAWQEAGSQEALQQEQQGVQPGQQEGLAEVPQQQGRAPAPATASHASQLAAAAPKAAPSAGASQPTSGAAAAGSAPAAVELPWLGAQPASGPQLLSSPEDSSLAPQSAQVLAAAEQPGQEEAAAEGALKSLWQSWVMHNFDCSQVSPDQGRADMAHRIQASCCNRMPDADD